MKVWIGRSLLVIGVIHIGFGFVFYHEVLYKLANEFFVNSIGRDSVRLAAFWFFITGFCLMLIGSLLNHIEKKGLGMPPYFKYAYMALTAVGCIMLPESGLWLMLVPGAGMFFKNNFLDSYSKRKRGL